MPKKWKRKKAERDAYYYLAKEKGLRSRAYFKLEDMDRRYKIFVKGDYVLDLGAYPGGWLQYISKVVGIDGLIVGVDIKDIKPMDDSPNVKYIQGDVFDEDTLRRVGEILGEKRFDVIVSDISPNISGIWELDTERIYLYNEKVLDYVNKFLRRGGNLVMKSFEGKRFRDIISRAKSFFKIVKIYKPRASRKRSAEIYVICFYFLPKSDRTSRNFSRGISDFKP